MDAEGWGSDGHYYANEPDELAKSAASRSMAARLRPLLQECLPGAEERVQRTVKAWNQSVRDQLRAETALRLSTADQQVAVPVRVTDGLPPPWHKVLTLPEPILRLVLMRSRIAEAVGGVRIVREQLSDVVGFVASELHANRRIPSEEELGSVQDLLALLADELSRVQLFEDIWREPVDCLGAYYFLKPIVEIYWMPIGFTAAQFEIDVEALTCVVLAHELAHAYTHLGQDIDGHQWATRDFAATSGYVVEGLAQYYARAVCRNVAARYPAALMAFDALLEHQKPGPYGDFESWTKGLQDPGEHLRRAMLECRKQGVRDYGRFRELVGVRRA